MDAHHHKDVCQFGYIHRQCRCPGVKIETKVNCDIFGHGDDPLVLISTMPAMMQIKENRFPVVRGYCPACRKGTLFLGAEGYVTCARLKCPDPEAATKLLLGET